MEPLISVIVPMHNAGAYISECIESILGQTYAKLEIIVVDDGSTDESLNLCRKYAERDERIKVVKQRNSGPNNARKKGLSYAKGDYICFVDSDDWLEKDSIEIMYQKMLQSGAEMVIGNYTFWENGMAVKRNFGVKDGVYHSQEEKEILFGNCFEIGKSVMHNIWGKLYSTELYRRAQAYVWDEVRIGEDLVCTYACIQMAQKIYVINQNLYDYRATRDSLIRGENINILSDVNKVYHNVIDVTESLGKEEILYNSVMEYMRFWAISATGRLFKRRIANIYIFPYELIPPQSKLILYGAGAVGQIYWRQVIGGNYCEIVAVIDSAAEKLNTGKLKVQSVEAGLRHSFDYILISVKDDGIAEEIRESLLTYGIKNEKILWKEPRRLEDSVAFYSDVI